MLFNILEFVKTFKKFLFRNVLLNQFFFIQNIKSPFFVPIKQSIIDHLQYVKSNLMTSAISNMIFEHITKSFFIFHSKDES